METEINIKDVNVGDVITFNGRAPITVSEVEGNMRIVWEVNGVQDDYATHAYTKVTRITED